jgi:hypothetical protein
LLPLILTTSEPINAWIFDVDSETYPNGIWEHTVCAIVQVGELVRIGNQADSLTKHLWAHTSIVVDNQIIPPENFMLATTLDLQVKYDPFGFKIPLGWYSSAMDVCFSADDFATGPHQATLKTMTTLGELFSYTWLFKRR